MPSLVILAFAPLCMTVMFLPLTPFSSLLRSPPLDFDFDFDIVPLLCLASRTIFWKRFSNQYRRRNTTKELMVMGFDIMAKKKMTTCWNVFSRLTSTVLSPACVLAPLAKTRESM